MDGRTDGRTDAHTHTHARTDGRTDGRTNKRSHTHSKHIKAQQTNQTEQSKQAKQSKHSKQSMGSTTSPKMGSNAGHNNSSTWKTQTLSQLLLRPLDGAKTPMWSKLDSRSQCLGRGGGGSVRAPGGDRDRRHSPDPMASSPRLGLGPAGDESWRDCVLASSALRAKKPIRCCRRPTCW